MLSKVSRIPIATHLFGSIPIELKHPNKTRIECWNKYFYLSFVHWFIRMKIFTLKLFSSNCVALFLSFGRFRSLGQFLIIGLNGHFPSPIINHDSRWYHETENNFKNAVFTNYLLDDFLHHLTFFPDLYTVSQ